MGLSLDPGGCVFLDTAPFIYFFEENPAYVERLARFFDAVLESDIEIVTSMVTYLEVLVLPERQGAVHLAARYRAFLTNSSQVSIHPLTFAVADEAARLRATHGLRTPDAIQLATARACGADMVLTNDAKWRGIPDFRIVLVDEL